MGMIHEIWFKISFKYAEGTGYALCCKHLEKLDIHWIINGLKKPIFAYTRLAEVGFSSLLL